jgi:hypothetical protein
MPNMKTSKRSRAREIPKAGAAANQGRAETVVDGKTGGRFLLTAKPTRTFGELAAPAKGIFSGPRHLSIREGFGKS